MVKIASNDALAVLRKYGVATEDHVPRHIEHLNVSHPSEINTIASFRFQKTNYFLVFDDTAEDDEEYIRVQILSVQGDAKGKFFVNPKEDSHMTYGMPFKGKDAYLFQVETGKRRLDIVLAEDYPEYSRSTWQKYIASGFVRVNGSEVSSPKFDIKQSDTVEFTIPDRQDHSNKDFPIIYKDDNVIVINKPIGVLSHSKGALNDEFTVADFFRRYSSYNTDTNRPGIVHRLDRDTSGVMIGARNAATATALQKQFSDRKTKKTYYAVIDGHLKNDQAIIDLPIGRNPTSPSKFRVDPKGKTAQTSYSVLQATKRYSLVELRPKTGRTHQLRVHAAYMGTPIHGDRVYGKAAERLYLHAHSLEITIPDGDRKVFEAPLPTEFQDVMNRE